MTEAEEMRKYAEAHGRGYIDIPIREIPGGGMISKRVYVPVRPLPCVRDEHGDIKMQSVKDLFQKINGELDELKDAIISYDHAQMRYDNEPIASALLGKKDCEHISEEACDTITAITTMLEALGIDAEMRDEAQRRVNQKNRERKRL